MTAELAEELGYERTQQGAVVTSVEPGSVAARSGLQVRDVIVSVDGRTVHSVRDFRQAMDDADMSRGIRLQVFSDRVRRFVYLKEGR